MQEEMKTGILPSPSLRRSSIDHSNMLRRPVRRTSTVSRKTVLTSMNTKKGRINEYRLVRRIGQGSYATVYLYKVKESDEQFAIKKMNKHALQSR